MPAAALHHQTQFFHENKETSEDDVDGRNDTTNTPFSNENLIVRDCDIVPGDIKMGRGDVLQRHPGNIWFRELIAENFDVYDGLRKTEQTEMCKKILEMVKLESRQFWKALPDQKKKELWVEVDDTTARQKVAYSFRTERRNRKRSNKGKIRQSV